MDEKRKNYIETINGMLKLIRVEYNLTQDKMAHTIGVSKKTLVECEKGRRSLGWSECVTLATVFYQSQVLQNSLGGEIADMIVAIAFDEVEVKYPKTMGGHVWWHVVREEGQYRIQQNIISKHFRLLDAEDRRVVSSFNLEVIEEYLGNVK